MRCLLCKADAMERGVNTYFAQLDTCYVIIENVPCFRCGQCGEVVYSASVMEEIEAILRQIQNISSKIFILDYSKETEKAA